MNALAAEALWRCSGETCPGVSREEAGTGVLAAGAGVVSERAAFLPSIPNAGMTMGNDFKATTMEIKGMRM